MKHAFVCPRCSGGKIYVIEQAVIPCCHDSSQVRALTVAASGWHSGQRVGLSALLEARVCGACGFSEFFTKNRDALATMEQLGVGQVRLLNGDEGGA